MRNLAQIIALGIVSVIAAGCAAPLEERVQRLQALDKQHFYDTAKVSDDDLTLIATIDTSKGFEEERNLLDENRTDAFLRAVITKKTGKTTYMVYQLITYRAPNWRFYHSATYQTAEGPVIAEFIPIGRDVNCQGMRYSGGCFYSEHVGFVAPEILLQNLAALYDTGHRGSWNFKFSSRVSDADLRDAIPVAEIAGFLDRVRDYKKQLNLAAN